MRDASATAIARRASLGRLAAYNCLESMVKKGIVTTYDSKGVRCYTALAPHELVALYRYHLDEQKYVLESLESSIVGELAFDLVESPHVSVFHGIE